MSTMDEELKIKLRKAYLEVAELVVCRHLEAIGLAMPSRPRGEGKGLTTAPSPDTFPSTQATTLQEGKP